MAVEYPDVMNDVIDARQRFESGAVQYLAQWVLPSMPAGSVAQMVLVLQSVMDVPVQVALQIIFPEPKGRMRRRSLTLFEVFQPNIQLTLDNGEVVKLVIPVHVQPHTPPGEYEFEIHIRSGSEQGGTRIRIQRAESRMRDLKIRHPQGLGITQIVPWGYEAQQASKQSLSLTVSGAQTGEQPQDIDLKPQFDSLWTLQNLDLIPLARREVNERRIYISSDLATEQIYLPIMRASQVVFEGGGVQLHVGEAIFLNKMLTHTVTYMMQNTEWQECLLVPIYAYAQAGGQPTNDTLWLVTELGYTHVLELAIALGFSILAEKLGREPWTPAEQRALRDYIVACLDRGSALPAEFLYLPLILGGMVVAGEIVLQGESVSDSLRLLGKAKAERADVFADPDLEEINDIFDRLLEIQVSG
jgi:hypothetical protein